MQTSIIVPAYVFDEELKGVCIKAIDSVSRHTKDYELIVIDNASNEEYVEAMRNNVTVYVRNRENLGFAKAVNQGLKLAQGEFLAIVNNDVEVTENWLEPLILAAKENDGIYAPLEPEKDNGREYSGWCWLMSRGVFEKIGYLDERYEVMTFDDTDYWARALSLNIPLRKIRNSLVYHRHPTITFSKMPNKQEIFNKNRERFIEKWGFKPEERGL